MCGCCLERFPKSNDKEFQKLLRKKLRHDDFSRNVIKCQEKISLTCSPTEEKEESDSRNRRK